MKPIYPEKRKLTNLGFNVGEYGAYVEGKLLSEGTVFGNSYSFPRIIESLLHTGLSHNHRYTVSLKKPYV